MADILACANQKGGVGKTTTVVSLAAYLALDGLRVLVVDMDPQGNATSGLGAERSTLSTSVYDVLVAGVDVAEAVIPTALPSLALLPSTRDLAGAEVELVALPARERRLARALAPIVSSYDMVVIDCPPSLGLLTVNALTAAEGVIVPLQCEYYALEGVSHLLATIELVRAHLNPRLRLAAVLLTMYDGRTSLSSDVAAEARRHLGDLVLETAIPRSVRLAEAPSYGRPIPLYSPASRGAEAYRAVTAELLRATGRSPGPSLGGDLPLATPGTSGEMPAWATR